MDSQHDRHTDGQNTPGGPSVQPHPGKKSLSTLFRAPPTLHKPIQLGCGEPGGDAIDIDFVLQLVCV
jgi:hypothetical protein